MFEKLKRLRLPFLPKKIAEVPLADQIDAAIMEAKNYSLILDNDELHELFKNNFKTEAGVQIPPQELVNKLINHIEKNPPQTTEAFAVFVRDLLITMSIPKDIKK